MYDNELSSNGQDDADLQNSKGTLLFKLEMYEDAVVSFVRAIAIDTNTSVYYFNNAKALNKLKVYDQANLYFDQAIRLSPSNALYLYSKEINLVEKDLETNPNSHELLNVKGCFLLKLNDYSSAEKEFQKAICLDSSVADYHFHKGIAVSELGRIEEAHDCFEVAKTLNSNKRDFSIYQKINFINLHTKTHSKDAILYYHKGKLLAMLDDYATAIHCLNRALRLDPTVYKYYVLKANTLLKLDRKEDAIKCLNKANNLIV